jgi:hypothetical protein
LRAKRLRAVVHDDDFAKIAPKDIQVLQVVASQEQTMFAEKSISLWDTIVRSRQPESSDKKLT